MNNTCLVNLLVSQLKVAAIIKRLSNDLLQHKLDISLSELIVLMSAIAKPGLAQQDIAQKLHLSHAAISRQMSTLQDKGYLSIRPDQQDKRRTCIVATSQGKAIAKQAIRLVVHHMSSSLASLETNQIDQHNTTNNRLAQLLDPKSCLGQESEHKSQLFQIWHKLATE